MTHRKNFALTPVSAAIVTALGTSGTVAAQETDDLAIEEILVTATKREMSLQDIPHSIDVLSSIELQRMGAKDLESTLRALPSIGLVALQPGQNSLVVRGITTEPFEYRTDAQVAVYLDEQPMSSNPQQVGFRGIDIERVENLPGPQGTLFGASSQTGTIRYISNKPNFSGLAARLKRLSDTLKAEMTVTISTQFSICRWSKISLPHDWWPITRRTGDMSTTYLV